MMILGNFRLYTLSALLAGLAAPSLAAAPEGQARAERQAPAAGESARPGHSRRVELPFPLEFRSPERAPRASAPQESTGPHPFREGLLKRASLAETGAFANRGRRLSRHPDFS